MAFNFETITDFPIHLIIYIITFLPIMEAYRFCYLNREWREKSLWLHCTCLDFHEIDYFYAEASQNLLSLGRRKNSKELKRLGKLRYIHFLDYIMTNLAATEISRLSFRLHYSAEHCKNIDNWIRIAVNKRVKELSLDFSDGDTVEMVQVLHQNPQYVLPDYLYQNAASIRVLSLIYCGLGSCNFLNFVSLKSMSLTGVRITWVELLHVQLSCPLLESLSLVECNRLGAVFISLNFMRLKRLVLKYCDAITRRYELSLPSLKYFDYLGRPVDFVLRNLDALEVVVLEYIMLPQSAPDVEDNIRQLFDGFAGARILKVSTSFVKILATEYLLNGQALFRLTQIQHLEFTTCMERYELPTILLLLRSSPLLKTLNIIVTGFSNLTTFDEILHRNYPLLPDEIWTAEGCRLDHLEVVEMEGYRGSKNENDLVKFILRKSMSIKLVTLTPWMRGSNSSAYVRSMADIKAVARACGNADIICR